MDAVTIVEVPRERLDDLAPLWRALYEHHNEIAPQLLERSRGFERSWASRRRTEDRWLAYEPESFVLAAESGGRLVGYAFVRVRSGAGFAESWSVSDPLAELVTLVALPECRAQGVGTALMDAVESRLRTIGVQDMTLSVIVGNEQAIPFYERRGAVPFLTEFIKRVS
jgi:ribosomal protein S18 acetylase RimI-like enzyme